MRSRSPCFFKQVLVFCLLLAISAASASTSPEANIEDPTTGKPREVSSGRVHHHHSARTNLGSWASGLEPATLVTIGAILIIFTVFAAIIATIFQNPISGKMSPAYDTESDPYTDYGWNAYHQRFTRQLNDAAQTIMKTVEDTSSKYE